MNADLRPLRPGDFDAAAKVLAAAFESYPWTTWAIPTEDHASRLEEIQRLYLGYAHEHGLVVTNDDVRAVAAFLPPEPPEPSASMQERVAELHGDRLNVLAGVSLPAAPPGAWTLATVGVDPAHQGQGLGSAVVAAGLARIDTLAAPVHLETSDDRNVRLYGRLGFVTTATTRIDQGPVVHSMVRAAQ